MRGERCAFSFSLSVLLCSLPLVELVLLLYTWLIYWDRCIYMPYLGKLTIFPKLQVLKRFMWTIYYDRSQYFNNESIEFFEEFETLEKCYAKWPWKRNRMYVIFIRSRCVALRWIFWFAFWNAWWQFGGYCSVNLWLSDDSADKWWTKIKWNEMNRKTTSFVVVMMMSLAKRSLMLTFINEPHIECEQKSLKTDTNSLFLFRLPWIQPIEFTNRCRHDDRLVIGIQFMRFHIAKRMKHKRC